VWRKLPDNFFNPKNRSTLLSKKLKTGEKLNQFLRQQAGTLDPAFSTRPARPGAVGKLNNCRNRMPSGHSSMH